METFKIRVVADFLGAEEASAPETMGRPEFRVVDRDDFDQLIAELRPTARLGLPFCDVITLRSWEDFTPDGLVERVPGLARLADARRHAGSPRELEAALNAAGLELAEDEPAPARDRDAEADVPPTEGGLLDSILAGRASAEAPPPLQPADRVVGGGDRLLAETVRAIVVDSGQVIDGEGQRRLQDRIDQVLAERMRAILWHPAFRTLESRWRALRALVRGVPASADCAISMAHHPQRAFEASVAEAAGRGGAPALFEALQRPPSGIGPAGCDLLITDYGFDTGAASLSVLEALGEGAGGIGAFVLAEPEGSALQIDRAGEDELAAWLELQARPAAGRIGLAGPRVLLRLPYGAETDSVEAFPFEEVASQDERAPLLYGSAAFPLAEVMATAYAAEGPGADLSRYAQLADRPIIGHEASSEGEPGGPVLMVLDGPRREAFALMGLIAACPVKGTDSLRFAGIRTLARSDFALEAGPSR